MAELNFFRGLKNELLCSYDSVAEENECRSFASFSSNELESLSRLNTPFWFEYTWYPDLFLYWLTFWACYLMAEQQTISLLMVIRSSYTACLVSIYITILYLTFGSATVRSMTGLPDFMEHLTYVTQTRYTGAILNNIEFFNKTSLTALSWLNVTTGKTIRCDENVFEYGCRYINGSHYLIERYGVDENELDALMEPWFNFGVSYIFPLGLLVINMVLYLIPLPAFVKAKFRE